MSTMTFRNKNASLEDFGNATAPAENISLVPDERVSSLVIPGSLLGGFPQCDPNWNPADPTSPTPTFTCYLAPRLNSSADGLVQGRSARWVSGDTITVPTQSMVLAMVTKFPTLGEDPDTPPMMAGGTMWVTIQGRMSACGAGECE
ncbi:MAG: hypothetical protein JNK65_06885 [Deltaproteobacteria bacterium]|nr:hypothetical protein [Deltaproteobacteria bacterium]